MIEDLVKTENQQAKKLYRDVKVVTGLDIFKNTRKSSYIEARALFNFILYNTYGFTLAKIAGFYRENNKSYDHATVLHSLKNFEMYRRFSPQVNEWLESLENTQLGDRATRALTKQLVTYLTNDNLKVAYEHIKTLYEAQDDTESTN